MGKTNKVLKEDSPVELEGGSPVICELWVTKLQKGEVVWSQSRPFFKGFQTQHEAFW